MAGLDMLYSSGTTGMPKGITKEFPNTPLEGTPGGVMPLLSLLFGMDDSKRYLSPAPFYHAAPLRFCLATHALDAAMEQRRPIIIGAHMHAAFVRTNHRRGLNGRILRQIIHVIIILLAVGPVAVHFGSPTNQVAPLMKEFG